MIPRMVLLTLILSGSACRAGEQAGTLTELLRTRSGDLDVVLLSEDDALGHDRDTFVLEFRSAADSSLVDAGQVKASATMPMPGSSPMFGSVALEPTGTPGRYTGTSDLSMAGTWRLTIEWDGPQGSGSATLVPMVQ